MMITMPTGTAPERTNGAQIVELLSRRFRVWFQFLLSRDHAGEYLLVHFQT